MVVVKGYRYIKTQEKINSILSFMNRFFKDEQRLPSQGDIADFMNKNYPEGKHNQSTSAYYLKLLARDGFIKFVPNRRPNYKIIKNKKDLQL